jgi:hypothetical protein
VTNDHGREAQPLEEKKSGYQASLCLVSHQAKKDPAAKMIVPIVIGMPPFVTKLRALSKGLGRAMSLFWRTPTRYN